MSVKNVEITFGNKRNITKLTAGNENIMANKNETQKKVLARIEIDHKKVNEILNLCLKDLKYPKTINNETIELIENYNETNRMITFNYTIQELQNILKIKEPSLSEFFSWFFTQHFRKYCKELYDALPESLPLYQVEDINSKIIRVDLF